jgi:hypothetical protein
MALAIAWRNLTISAQTTKRCIKFGKRTTSNIYLVQELMAGADDEQWAYTSVLAVWRRHVPSPCVPSHASNRLPAAGNESHEPEAS